MPESVSACKFHCSILPGSGEERKSSRYAKRGLSIPYNHDNSGARCNISKCACHCFRSRGQDLHGSSACSNCRKSRKKPSLSKRRGRVFASRQNKGHERSNRTDQTNEPTWIGERVHKDMNECMLCGGETVFSLSASFIFSFKPFPASIKCHDCLSKLVLLKKHPTCPGCCRRQIDHSLCQDCIRWKRRYLTDSFNHLALYAYNEPMK